MLTTKDFETKEYNGNVFKDHHVKLVKSEVSNEYFLITKDLGMTTGPFRSKNKAMEEHKKRIPMYKHESDESFYVIYEFYNHVELWLGNKLVKVVPNVKEAIEYLNLG